MSGRVVIRNAVVPHLGAGATVVVEGREIVEVAAPGRAVVELPGDWDVDADGRLVVPGAVDCHANLGLGGVLRLTGAGARPPPTVADLRAGVRAPLEGRLGPELLEPLVRAGALAALRAGVTCVLEVVRGANGAAAELLEADARALASVGIRGAVAYGARGARGGAGGGVDEVLASARFAERHARAPRLRGLVGLDGLADASEEALEAAAEPASRAGLHACVGEDESDLAHAFARWARRPVEVLAARGLLGARTVIAHAGTAVHAEGALLAEAGTCLAVTPRAAMFWGAPLPPLLPFVALGVPLVLGTDGLFPDVASEAVAALTLLRHGERSASPAAGLVARTAWSSAARLASTLFGERLGLLAPGAVADLVVLDWRPPFPLPDAADGDLALLHAGAPAAWVLVDGEVRLREGRLLGGDEAEIAARAREAAAALLRA